MEGSSSLAENGPEVGRYATLGPQSRVRVTNIAKNKSQFSIASQRQLDRLNISTILLFWSWAGVGGMSTIGLPSITVFLPWINRIFVSHRSACFFPMQGKFSFRTDPLSI